MQVLEKREGVVTNHEVLSLLRRQAAARDDEEKRQKLPGARRTAPAVTQWRSQQEVRAITRQVIEYLEQGCAADQSRESIAEFMRAMEPFGLTQAEVLNLVNTRPRSLVEALPPREDSRHLSAVALHGDARRPAVDDAAAHAERLR